MRIRYNAQAVDALRTSRVHQNRLQNAIGSLSSGKSLNTAKDAPADVYQSDVLKSKVHGLGQASDNVENSISLLQSAQSHLEDISSILTEMRQYAVQSANEATTDSVIAEQHQYEFETLLSRLSDIAESAKFGGKKLLDGSMGVSGVTTGEHLRFIDAAEDTPNSPEKGFAIDITHTATRASMVGSMPLTAESIGEGFVIKVREGGRIAELDTTSGEMFDEIQVMIKRHARKHAGEFEDPFNFAFEEEEKLEESKEVDANQQQADSATSPTVEEADESLDIRQFVVYRLNEILADKKLNVEAVTTHDGRLALFHFDYGDEPDFEVSCTLEGLISQESDVWQPSLNGSNVKGTIGGGPAVGQGRILTASGGGPAEGAVIEYSGTPGIFEIPVLDPLGRHVSNEPFRESQEMLLGSYENPIIEGYLHISQQSQSVQLGDEAKEFETFSLNSVKPHDLGRGVVNLSEFKSLSDIDLTARGGGADAVIVIDKAFEDISELRRDLGSFEKNTLQSTLGNINSENLNSGRTRSMLQDADSASEMAELTQSQIQLSMSQSMIAQSHQKSKNVMKLIHS